MTARRTEVRHAFAALLTGLPSAGNRVFLSRMRPLGASELPAVLVYSGEAECNTDTVGLQAPDLTTYRLRADVLVKVAEGIEDIADQILEEITGAVFASIETNTLSGKVHGLKLLGISEPDIDDSLEKPALRVSALFEATYSA